MRFFSAAYLMKVQSALRYYRNFLDMPDPNPLSLLWRKDAWIHWRKNSKIRDRDRKEFDVLYEGAQTFCGSLELTASTATIKKMRQVLANPEGTYVDFWAFGKELEGRLCDEIENRTFVALTLKEADYYNKPRDGWNEVIARFPNAAGDVEEARKCFALSRYAAAVFHAIQAIEVGLIELGVFLDVNDPRSGWTAVAGALEKIVNKKHHERSSLEKENFAFLEQIHGTVEGLKNAWRNKISHAQGKLTLLTSDFSPDVAEEILYSSRAFMRRLAEGLPPKDRVKD